MINLKYYIFNKLKTRSDNIFHYIFIIYFRFYFHFVFMTYEGKTYLTFMFVNKIATIYNYIVHQKYELSKLMRNVLCISKRYTKKKELSRVMKTYLHTKKK